MTLQTGVRLGSYEIRGPVGAGGMGEVYRAWDERLRREVAIKVLPESAATDPDRLRRFDQEARAAGALNHPNVLAVYDVGSHDSLGPEAVPQHGFGQRARARVGETSLPRVVGEIRRALGDRPEQPSFVRTVQRFGYAFVGEAVVEGDGTHPQRPLGAAPTGCTLLWGERIVPLAAGPNVLGRDPESAVAIPSGLVSRHHARLVVDGDRAVLHDLGSKNGTLVGGRRVEGSVELSDGDEIRIGPVLLVFCAPATDSTRSRR
jgi:hypothetical protein